MQFGKTKTIKEEETKLSYPLNSSLLFLYFTPTTRTDEIKPTMELNRLCLILPADIDEIEPSDRRRNCPSSSNSRHLRRRITTLIRYLRDQILVLTGFCRSLPDKSYRDSQKFHDITGIVFSDKVGGNNPRIFSYAELYIGSNGFSPDGVLGSGGFGRVYKAVLPSDGTAVAVKCVAEKEERFEKTFAAELAAVARLRHRNLVRLRGWCVHDDQLLLVYDYMPNRSLDRILFHHHPGGRTPLDWAQRRRIVTGLAAALFYLHEQLDAQIIHRDVKTSNVMLDSGYNAKLGDFGLARWLEHELEASPPLLSSAKNYQFRLAEKTRIGGTIGYLPPENFQKRSVATAKSDVFGFGIVALEVVSGRRAVDLSYPDEQIILLDWVRRLSDEGKSLQAGDKCLSDGSYALSEMQRLIHLGLLCSLHDPKSRPTMRWVLEALSCEQFGELPPLPSFHLHPLYISLSSPTTSTSDTTSTTTTTTTTNTPDSAALSNYVTANVDTMFITADSGGGSREKSRSSNRLPKVFPVVDTPQEITFKEIVAATNNFSENNVVAEMDFGTGYRGYLNNRQHVLVKRLGMKTCPALRMRFSNELQNLGRLRHRHLMQLRGWCTEQGEMLVVYDHLSQCLLSHLLFHPNHRNGKNSVLLWHHRYNIVKALASAVVYLHEEWEEQVIHRHITSSVIGLDSDMNPRLGGFALAEFLTRNDHGHHVDTSRNASVRGIFGYMAPEYMKSGEATTKADVYSFGVVVLEVVSGRMAVDFRWPEVLLAKKVQIFEARKRPWIELVDQRLDGEYNLGELLRLVKVGLACTRSDPELRPSMSQIVSILNGNEECLIPVMALEDRRKQRRIDEWDQERMEEWEQRNVSSLSMIKNIQALGIN